MTHIITAELAAITILESERLFLRNMTPEDVTLLLQHFGNPAVAKFVETQPIKTLDQANEWLRWMGGFWAAKDGLRRSALRKEDLAVIGVGGFHRWNREANYAEIGFDILPPYHNQGYATEVAQLLIEFGWQHLKLNRIEADATHGNMALMRVLEKLGFKREGILRQRLLKGGKYYDVHRFALLRCEYDGDCA